MPRPRRGEVWLVRFPFSDLSATKVRPALVWSIHGQDIVVIGIFSRVPAGSSKTWVLLEKSHPGFARTGLKKTSMLRAEKLLCYVRRCCSGSWAPLPPDLMAQVELALKAALHIS